MSRFVLTLRRGKNGFPRVSGDEPWYRLTQLALDGFSPRERG